MLHGLTLIFLCQLVGEAFVRLLGIPVPGPVIGMVILLAWLVRGDGPSEPVRAVANGLLKYLPLFFVPAGVGLVTHGALLRADWLALVLAILGSTLFTMLLVGWLIERFAEPEAPGDD